MVAIHRSVHEHGKILGRRDQATAAILVASEVPSPSASSNPDAVKPPTNTKVLFAVIAVLAIFVISVIAVWKYQAWKRRKPVAASSLIDTKRDFGEKHINFDTRSSIEIEKPTKAYLTSPTDTGYTGWVPQIKITRESTVPAPAPTAPTRKPKPIPSLHLAEKYGSQFSGAMSTPPPSYIVANGGVESALPSPIPIPPNPPTTDTSPPTPPTPPATKKAASFKVPVPLPSGLKSPARSESFQPHDLKMPEESPFNASSESVNTPNGQKLPRLMSVVTTFTPSLEDELEVRLGDTVRMLDEYQDGWCLIQRVGRIDAPRGVIPRFCLHERRDIVPRNLPTGYAVYGSAPSPSRR